MYLGVQKDFSQTFPLSRKARAEIIKAATAFQLNLIVKILDV